MVTIGAQLPRPAGWGARHRQRDRRLYRGRGEELRCELLDLPVGFLWTFDRKLRHCGSTTGSVTAAESAAGAESLIIKSCPPSTIGRYVTIQQDDNSYLTLCEVVVFGAIVVTFRRFTED